MNQHDTCPRRCNLAPDATCSPIIRCGITTSIYCTYTNARRAALWARSRCVYPSREIAEDVRLNTRFPVRADSPTVEEPNAQAEEETVISSCNLRGSSRYRLCAECRTRRS